MALPVHDLPLFVAAALLLNLTPGPDMLYVAGTAAARGVRHGIAAALGIGAGCGVHIALGALGVSALIAASPTAFGVLKAAGAVYLVWAGIALWRRRDEPATRAPQPASAARAFAQGALVNALNPKVALFFLALLPQFIDAGKAGQAAAFVALGLLFDAGGTAVNIAVAAGLGLASGRLARAAAVRRGLERTAGALFVALGLRLALGARG